MIIYYIDDDDIIRHTHYGDIANLESFHCELDDIYPNGWSEDELDLQPDDEPEASEMDIY